MPDRDRIPAKSLNGKLFDEGFVAVDLIENSKLAERLAIEAIKLASGMYTDMRIIPGDIALEGSSRRLREPSHIVYAKLNEKHECYDPKRFYIVSAHCNGGAVPLHCIR